MTGLSGALSSSDRVVETIVKGIRDGRLVPGQRLVESDLTTRLGVSRGPVALRISPQARTALTFTTR